MSGPSVDWRHAERVFMQGGVWRWLVLSVQKYLQTATHTSREVAFFFFTDVALLERIRQSMDYGSVFERRDKLEKAVRVEEVSSGVE